MTASSAEKQAEPVSRPELGQTQRVYGDGQDVTLPTAATDAEQEAVYCHGNESAAEKRVDGCYAHRYLVYLLL